MVDRMKPAGSTVLSPGTLFHARYRIVRCIKAGGMGEVHEVVDERTNTPRALKVMRPEIVEDREMRGRFTLEAKVTGNIASDHIVRVSDAGVDEATGMPFLVMDFLQGQELGGMSDHRGPLPATEVVLYLRQAALALDKTQAAGIVHRDLKPENLFVTYRDDGSPCVKILDFGIAKVVAQSAALKTRAIGTPMYMAPEQLRGEGTIGPRVDLLALGHIAYALLSGQPYWQRELMAAESIYPFITKIMEGVLEAPSVRASRHGVTLPASFDAWFLKATATRPEDRFERATAQIAALAEALGLPPAPLASVPSGATSTPVSKGPPSSAPGPGSATELAPMSGTGSPVASEAIVLPTSRAVSPKALGAGLVVAVLGAGVFFALSNGKSPSNRATADAGVDVAHVPASVADASANVADAAADVDVDASRRGLGPLAAPSVEGVPANAPAVPIEPPGQPPTRSSFAAPPRPSEPPRPPKQPPTSAAKNCNPPFTLDDAGHRDPKPECL
jgi:serine/threonine-protein kinase